MSRFRLISKFCLIISILLISVAEAAIGQDLSDLKNKITNRTLPNKLLGEFEFFFENNRYDFNTETDFLNSLNPNFGSEYLKGYLLQKNGNFSGSFNLLFNLFDDRPEYYSYYDLLSAAALLTGNEKKVKSASETITDEKYKNYLLGQIEYRKAQYRKAKEYFAEVLSADSASFEPVFFMSYTLRNLGDYNSALMYLNKAEKLISDRHYLLAKIKVAKGSLFYLSGKYNDAEKLYSEGEEIASEFGYSVEYIKALLNLGIIYDEEGKIKKARSNFISAVKFAGEIGDDKLRAACLSELAVSYTFTGESIKARKTYEESFSLFKLLNDKKRLAFTAINIGNNFLNLANYGGALKYYETGLKEAGDNVRTKMLALRGLGDVYTNLSDYSRALEYYEKARKFAVQIKDVESEAEINIGLGIMYYNLELPRKALEALRKSNIGLSESENPYLISEINQKIGIIYEEMDSLNAARSFLKRAKNLAVKYGDVYSELFSETFLADIEMKHGNYAESRALLNKLIPESESAGYYQLLAMQYLTLGELSGKKNDINNQIDFIKKGLRFAEKANDLNARISADIKLGKIYLSNGVTNAAEKRFLSAVNLIEKNSNRLLEKADIQVKYFSNYISAYNSLAEIYLSENKIEKAFEILDKSKARNSRENLLNLKIKNIAADADLLDRMYDYSWRLERGVFNGAEADSIKFIYESTKDSIIARHPELGKYFNNDSFSLAKLQKKLEDDEYLISYYASENYLYAFRISNKEITGKKINISAEELKKMKISISPYFNNMFDSEDILFNKDLFAFNADGANKFYAEIVSPITAGAPKNSRLIFSLPPELTDIPFEFLIVENSGKYGPYSFTGKKFLIEDYSISYTPSAEIWAELNSEELSENNTALLFGDPVFEGGNNAGAEMRGLALRDDLPSRSVNFSRLKYSKNEIQNIGSLLGNGKLFLSNEATETAFKKNVQSASIVHLSTHSFLYKNMPFILFSNTDSENDGLLETGEIIQMNINPDLVVLSSCKSGLGAIDKAEGILGMQKAFFDAGAKSVVVSLWDVNDRYTSTFMKYFYSFLSEGVSKPDALRKAKIKFLKNDNPNPYYWAPFTLSGNVSPINIDLKNNSFIGILSITAFILFAVFIYLIKNRRQIRASLMKNYE